MISFRRQFILTALTLLPFTAGADNLLPISFRHTNNEDQETDLQSLPKPDPAGNDILILGNGDLIHGVFSGLNEGLLWDRKDIAKPIHFKLPNVKNIIFDSANGVKFDQNTSFVSLVNGDHIPAEIIALDEKTLTINSPIAGELKIPRTHVAEITPNPFSGKLAYLGPYNSQKWLTLTTEEMEVEEEEKEETEEGAEEEKSDKIEEEKKEEEEEERSWAFLGNSFYSLNSTPLILPELDFPDSGRIRFKVDWKGRMNFSFILNADLKRPIIPEPEPEENEDDNEGEEEKKDEEVEEKPALEYENLLDLRQGTNFQELPWMRPQDGNYKALTYGSCYVLTLYSSYPNLVECSFDDNGKPVDRRIDHSRSNLNLRENGSVEIEIRYDRERKIIILFANGKYITQWSNLEGLSKIGSAIGFVSTTRETKVKISEIAVSSWDGASDNAKSMTHPDRDIILLTNGTDRISGNLLDIKNGIANFKTEYADTQLPLSNLALVNLKSSDQATEDQITELEASWKDAPVTVIYEPFGKIQISLTSATKTKLIGHSPYLGDISLDLTKAHMMSFFESSPDITDWLNEF